MIASKLKWQYHKSITTPAFIYDENEIQRKISNLRKIQDCNILYPLKPCAITDILQSLAPLIRGFSVSSLFEAMLAKSVLQNHNVIHLTTPGLRSDEIDFLDIEFVECTKYLFFLAWAKTYQLCRQSLQSFRAIPF